MQRTSHVLAGSCFHLRYLQLVHFAEFNYFPLLIVIKVVYVSCLQWAITQLRGYDSVAKLHKQHEGIERAFGCVTSTDLGKT